MMRRREFIALIGGAAAWPLAARAQHINRVRRIVFLHALSENDPEAQARVIAFGQALEALGWVEHHNIQIEHRFSSGNFDRLQAYAADLVSSAPDLFVASSTPVLAALKQATRTIPIVFAVVNDPVGQGFVSSLARPGGNITGFTFIDPPLIGKWLEMLKEVAPSVTRISLIFNPHTVPYYPAFLRESEPAAATLGVELSATPMRDEAEVTAAITEFARKPGGALLVAPDPFTNVHRDLIMALTVPLRIPAIYGFRRFAAEGALISYGPDAVDIVRRSASYVDRILKGSQPSELPVQGPVKFEMAINLKTAKALGLTVPDSLLARADEVIE